MDIASLDYLQPLLHEFTYPQRVTVLQRHLGLLAHLTQFDEEHLNPSQRLDHTTISACLRLFTHNHPNVFAFVTWTETLLGPQSRELQRFDSLEPNTLDVVPWPFLKYGHFVLCVIRQNQSATILGDSLGTAPTSRFIEEVQNRLNATTRFKGWHVSAGHSAQQENFIDCGISLYRKRVVHFHREEPAPQYQRPVLESCVPHCSRTPRHGVPRASRALKALCKPTRALRAQQRRGGCPPHCRQRGHPSSSRYMQGQSG